MKAANDDEEMAMAISIVLPKRFDPLISALDAHGDEKTFTFKFVKTRLLQEEQLSQPRIKALSTETKRAYSFLVNVSSPGVAATVKICENASIMVVRITLQISISSNTPISERDTKSAMLCERKP